jgi:hypothetical protein
MHQDQLWGSFHEISGKFIKIVNSPSLCSCYQINPGVTSNLDVCIHHKSNLAVDHCTVVKMAEFLQPLVDHFQREFLEGTEDAKADFTADVESWARVHGLVMGNGQVCGFNSTKKKKKSLYCFGMLMLLFLSFCRSFLLIHSHICIGIVARNVFLAFFLNKLC